MSILDKDTGGNIVPLVRPNCQQLFFVYAGGMGRMGYHLEGISHMAFLQRSGLLRRNVVFLRDPHTLFYTKGVSDEISDQDALIEWHFAYIDSLKHVKEVYCLGNSAGGWASMFFGYLLGAKKSIALAPAGQWGLPLLQEMLLTPNETTDYTIYFDPNVEDDKAFATALADRPDVALNERGHGHLMLNGLLNSGELVEILPPFKGVGD